MPSFLDSSHRILSFVRESLPAMFKMLWIKIGDTWLPALCESPTCPLPVYVVIREGFTADMTEEEWIEEYKKRTGSDKKYPEEIKFSNVVL